MEISLVIVTFLSTLSLVALAASLYLTRLTIAKSKETKELCETVKVAYNAQSDTLEQIINKLHDLETRIGLKR